MRQFSGVYCMMDGEQATRIDDGACSENPGCENEKMWNGHESEGG